MHRVAVGFCIVGILAGGSALATELPEPPTLENTAGAWTAVTQTGTHYRIVFDGHGGGSLGFAVGGLTPEAVLYSIVGINFDEYNIRMRITERGHARGKEFVLTGNATPYRLTLRGKSFIGEELRFYPDAEWRQNSEALRQALPDPAP